MQEFDEIAPFYDVMYSDRHDDLMMYLDFVRQFGGPGFGVRLRHGQNFILNR